MNTPFNRYVGKDNYGRPKADYLNKLTTLSEEALYKECENIIWLSAFAGNNPRSDYHWQADACYDECKNRDKLAIYQRAYDYHTK